MEAPCIHSAALQLLFTCHGHARKQDELMLLSLQRRMLLSQEMCPLPM